MHPSATFLKVHTKFDNRLQASNIDTIVYIVSMLATTEYGAETFFQSQLVIIKSNVYSVSKHLKQSQNSAIHLI